jgi:hypothetical protein
MLSVRKEIIDFLYSFGDNEFHELNGFLKAKFPDTHPSFLRSEITALVDKKRIEVAGNNHNRWGQMTPHIHAQHNVEADLENWKVSAKIQPNERELLDIQKEDEEVKLLKIEVLTLQKEDLELKNANKELNKKFQEAQHQLTKLQLQEIKRKRLFAILGALGGVILTIITEYLLGILKLK